MKKSHKKILFSIPGWEEFVSNDLKKFRSFEEAREFARNLKLNNNAAWQKWSKYGQRPCDIPSTPSVIYKDSGWVSWGDWLGTGNLGPQDYNFLSFEKAREFVRNLKLDGHNAWRKWKSNNRPNDIPASPDVTYKDSGWVSWGDWLGTGNTQKKNFLVFEEARKFVRNLKLDGQKAWNKWRKNKPENIPSHPYDVYKDSGWVSLGDFLGTGTIAPKNRKFLSFEEARKFARDLNLSGGPAWKKWSKSSERPEDIPSSPATVYKDSGWVSLGDFLGTGTIATYNRKYLSFEEARKFVRNLKLSGQAAWREWCKSGDKPDDIPASSNLIYKSSWVSWGYFLGAKNIRKKNFLSFKEARKFAHSLKLSGKKTWYKWSKSGERPTNIPSTPNVVYKDYWVSWGDWLGKK